GVVSNAAIRLRRCRRGAGDDLRECSSHLARRRKTLPGLARQSAREKAIQYRRQILRVFGWAGNAPVGHRDEPGSRRQSAKWTSVAQGSKENHAERPQIRAVIDGSWILDLLWAHVVGRTEQRTRIGEAHVADLLRSEAEVDDLDEVGAVFVFRNEDVGGF